MVYVVLMPERWMILSKWLMFVWRDWRMVEMWSSILEVGGECFNSFVK